MTKDLTIVSTTSPESKELVRGYLDSHHSGILGTSDSSGNPHVAAVYYERDDDFCLTFATKTETQKAKNMLENQQVAFVIYDEKEQATIQITGRVERIEDAAAKNHSINAMVKKSAELSGREFTPAEKLEAGDYIAFKLVPLVIRLGIFARPVSSEEEYYETLLFSQ
ncbi:hypothetical protein A2707_02665 [Candidatus Saccharibacteria bacterium RIFCSPHIGHO2_01_FULL_45_15]|nr:MAG: hypothetical protein A2707_02665 [Candidatus Saccharibacteria bacterium RIFCSPHIGHO2_01_FULL_45_15]OGL27826.1 MAG: hypothetical protein A3C39_04980 [Candidatus Saccharibacteria bacterium RIFCSPHIGHO2_02_FULL_46_12]OGL31832.1 MAG: hypothetical protein A3E76_03260 [Candidatus Saccharibacteria bacterium RIFCSPHIGHO2_12_FULL_44_22]